MGSELLQIQIIDEQQLAWVRHVFEGHVVWGIRGPQGMPVVYSPSLGVGLVVTTGTFEQMSAGTLPECVMERLRPRLDRPREVAPDLPPNAFHLGVGLTTNCSLACCYCHAEADKPVVADEQVVMASIRHAFSAASKTERKVLSASFAVGGEPTLPWDLFKRTVLALKDSGLAREYGVASVHLSMTTNAFYGDEKRHFIGEHFNALTISCDGPPDLQDCQRPDRSGGPTHATVTDSIRYFLGIPGLRLSLRSTISNLGVDRQASIVRHFVSEFGPDISIAFEPMVPIGRGGAPDCQLQAPDRAAFARGFMEALHEAERLGTSLHTSGPVLSYVRKYFCGAMMIPSFAVCVDGSVTACHRDQNAEDYRYGRVSAGDCIQVDEEAKSRIKAFASEVPQECVDCFAVQNCGGGCPDARKFGQLKCDLSRTLLFRDLCSLILTGKGGDGHGHVR